jgi:predicted ester cyclase
MSENKALILRIYKEMWNMSNPSLAVEIFERPEGVERFVSQFLSSFPALQHTVDGMIEEGDQVAVQFTARGTHQGQWLQFPPTGRSIQYTGVTVARITGRQITQHHTWWDKIGLVDQISEYLKSDR